MWLISIQSCSTDKIPNRPPSESKHVGGAVSVMWADYRKVKHSRETADRHFDLTLLNILRISDMSTRTSIHSVHFPTGQTAFQLLTEWHSVRTRQVFAHLNVHDRYILTHLTSFCLRDVLIFCSTVGVVCFLCCRFLLNPPVSYQGPDE